MVKTLKYLGAIGFVVFAVLFFLLGNSSYLLASVISAAIGITARLNLPDTEPSAAQRTLFTISAVLFLVAVILTATTGIGSVIAETISGGVTALSTFMYGLSRLACPAALILGCIVMFNADTRIPEGMVR